MSLYFMLHAACFLFMAIFSCKLSSIILDFTTHLGSTNNLSGDFVRGFCYQAIIIMVVLYCNTKY